MDTLNEPSYGLTSDADLDPVALADTELEPASPETIDAPASTAPTETIEALRDELRAHLVEGTVCPVCDQHAQQYRRKLNSGMALALVTMYQRAGRNWCHKPTVLAGVGSSARDESLLRFWGLIEERHKTQPQGRTGWWRVTAKGEQFIAGHITVPRYVWVYAGTFLGFDGDQITLADAAGSRFSLADLLDDTRSAPDHPVAS